MNTFDNLKNFYNAQASKFHNTRKKHWPEMDHIIKHIQNHKSKNLNILELGCGDGRLVRYLKQTDKNINYTGVDLSENLIQIAKDKYGGENTDFIQENMIKYIQDTPQQHFDFVVLIASFQHLPDKLTRNKVLSNIYKTLNYDGQCMMINWSFSNRFIKKYKKNLIKSILKSLITLGGHKFNDLQIPWQGDKITFHRYYHIFLLKEITKLHKYNGFIVDKSGYIDNDGKLVQNFQNARNTFILASKDVFKS